MSNDAPTAPAILNPIEWQRTDVVAMQPSPSATFASPPLLAGANPRWNDVFPIDRPSHDGAPHAPGFVGFGDPGPAIGQLVSIASNYPAYRPQPTLSSQPGLRVALAVGAGLFGTLACQMIYRQIVIGMTGKELRQWGNTLSALHVLVFVGGAVLAVGAYLLSGLVVKKVIVGPTFTCTMIGTEGMATFTRTPTADTANVVPFADVIVLQHDRRETTVLKDQYGNVRGRSTDRTFSSTWRHEDGRVVHGFHWRGMMGREPSDPFSFIDAATRAQRRHRANAKLPLLDGPGLRIDVASPPGSFHLQRGGVTVALGNQRASVTPPEIGSASVHAGTLTIRFPWGPVTLEAAAVPDLHLLLIALQHLGVHVN